MIMHKKKVIKWVVSLASVALLAGLGWLVSFNAESRHNEITRATSNNRVSKFIPDVGSNIKAKVKSNVQSNGVLSQSKGCENVKEKLMASEADQQSEFLKKQIVVDRHAAENAPASLRYPTQKALAYREGREVPKAKGGKETVIREWLVKPVEDGYVNHLEEEYAENDAGELKLIASREYVANQIIATIDGEVKLEDFKADLAKYGAEVRNVLMTMEKGARLVTVATPEITFDSVTELVAAAGKTSAQPKTSLDIVRSFNRVPNDTRYSQQWGLTKIGAPTVWEYVRDASSTVVAVIDSGVYYTHEDLNANMWQNPQTGRYSGVTGDTYGMRCFAGVKSGNPLDNDGHGTHCAGIIGAVGNNSKGVSGVAWSAKIMAVRITNDDWSSCYDSDIVTGMDYAKTMGAKILSCSWGGTGYSSALYSAFNAMRTAGILCVCAAGNGGSDGVGDNNDSIPYYPSFFNLDNIIAVAATQSSDSLASFSNYGTSSVDIAAPGVSILSTYNSSNSGYAQFSGTSMATPFVAGAAALVWSYYPSDNYAQIAQRIYTAGQSVSALSNKIRTGKRLSLSNIIVPTPSAPIATATRGTYADKVVVSWSAVSGATHYKVWRATTSTGTKTARSGWITSTSYNDAPTASDTTPVAGTGYYYFVQAATSSSGANASAYSSSAYGYRSTTQTYPDSWDPTDNTMSGATALSIDGVLRTHGQHGLNENDLYDYFKFNLTANRGYTFESTGDYDVYGEIYNASGTRLVYNDDGGSNRNFKITYTPTSSDNYYLRVRKYSSSSSGTYTYRLKYQSIYPDNWDPTDNTASGATLLTPSTTVSTTARHGLNANDSYDFYKIYMTAGRTYCLESTGSYDMYGELYKSQTATSTYRVTYDDDSGDGFNFKIVYTPTVTQYYYLRVRRWSTGQDGLYQIKYSVTIPETHDLSYIRHREWSDSAFLTNERDGTSGKTAFTTSDSILVKYSFYDAKNNDINVAITNLIAVFNVTDPAVTNVEGAIEVGFDEGLEAGKYWRSNGALSINAHVLSPGSYLAFIYLNSDGRIVETDYDNNYQIIPFTVASVSTKTLSSISVIAPQSLVEGSSTNLACTATYSDGSTERVTAVTWGIESGASYAQLDGTTLTARDVETPQTIRLSASYTYSGITKTATHTMSVIPNWQSPYGDPIQYPNPAMTIMARVHIDGQLASEGTVLYAFVGDEVRGRIELGNGGVRAINVFVAENGERIMFKAWSPLTGETYVCNEPLSAVIGGSQGNPTSPYEIACYSFDAFGAPVQYPNPPMTVLAHVSIFDVDAVARDMVGVFCGDELRGKGAVTIIGGKAIVTLTVQIKSPGEQLTFKVWDASEETLHNARGYLTGVVGGSAGTPAAPYQITVASIVTQVVSLGGSGWQFVSINVLPEDNAPGAVFSDITNRIERVSCGSEVYNPSWPDAYNTLSAIVPGKAYWVKVKDSVTSAITFSVEGAPADTATTTISLASGWNAVGYVPQQAGTTRSVLANFLSANKIVRVSGGNYSFDPSWPDEYNTLTAMQPGIGYWINASGAYSGTFVEPTGSSSSMVAAAIDAMSFESPWDTNDLDSDPTPATTIMGEVKLWGAKASYGDAVIAVFAGSSTKPCAVQAVNTLGGVSLSMCKYPGNHLTIKVWDSNTGVMYDAASTFDITAQNAGGVIESDIVVSGTAPTYKVVFDLDGLGGGSGVRTGGGALTQQVTRCAAPVLPTVKPNPGFEFIAWDVPESIKCDVVAHATYQVVETPTVTVSFSTQGGSACASRTYYVGYEYGELPTTELEGKAFLGWYTTPTGDGAEVTASSCAAADVTCLYARWTSSSTIVVFDVNGGLNVSGPLYVEASCGLAMPILISAPIRAGYKFCGYFDAKTGGVKYYNDDLTSAKTWDKSDRVAILYARWEVTEYAITYSNIKPGAVNPEQNPSSYVIANGVTFSPLEDTNVIGYKFVGWQPARIETGTIGTVNVVALWEKRKYSLNVPGLGAGAYEYGSVVTAQVAKSGIQGYTTLVCVGWNGGTGDIPVSGSGTQAVFTVTQASSSINWLYQTNYWFEVKTDEGEVTALWPGYSVNKDGCWIPYGVNIGVSVSSSHMDLYRGFRNILDDVMYGDGNQAEVNIFVDAPKRLRAVFDDQSYQITYAGTKGMWNSNPVTYTKKDEIVFTPLSDAYGYKFLGWEPASIKKGTENDITVTAKWRTAAFPVSEILPDMKSAKTYLGYDCDGEDFVSVQVVASKVSYNKKTDAYTTKISATLQYKDEAKKVVISGVYDMNGSEWQTFANKDNREITLSFGCAYLSAKVDGTLIALAPIAKTTTKFAGVYNIAMGTGVFTVAIGKNGTAQLTGTLRDGRSVGIAAKVAGSVDADWIYASFVNAKLGVGLAVEIDADDVNVKCSDTGSFFGTPVGKPGTLVESARFYVVDPELFDILGSSLYSAYFPNGLSITQDARNRWIVAGGAKAGRVVLLKGTADVDETKTGENPSALRLTYTAKTGKFVGTFKAYAPNSRGVPAPTTFTVRGVLVNGRGYGYATNSKRESVPIWVE